MITTDSLTYTKAIDKIPFLGNKYVWLMMLFWSYSGFVTIYKLKELVANQWS